MADHNLCTGCDTAAHCYRNGCIPLAEESALTAARSSGGCTELQDEPLSRPEKAMGWVSFALAAFIAFGAASVVAWYY